MFDNIKNRFSEPNTVDWEKRRDQVFNRDDYTCQRCFHMSGPHADGDGRVLQAHHINMKSEGGSDNMENLVTLCRPCHGVQHPDNEEFDDDRHRADTFPDPSANPDVAYMNSSTHELTVERFLSDIGTKCSRCRVDNIDEFDYFTYPNFNLFGSGRTEYPADDIGVLCERCVLYVIDGDGDVESWMSEDINEIYSISNDEFNSPEEIYDKYEPVQTKASILSSGKFAVFDPTAYDDKNKYYAKRVANFMYNNPAVMMLIILIFVMTVLWLLSRIGVV